MKFVKAPLTAALLGVSTLGLSVAAPSETQATSAVPIDVWALRDVVNAVDLSPDGKHLLVHINPSREGDYLLQIYKTDDLSTPYRTLNADPMEINSARWVSDNVIYGTAWQIKRESVRRQEDDTRNYATYFYDLKANKFQQVRGRFSIASLLPDEPDKILIGTGVAVDGGLGNDPSAAFRPQSYYRLNLETGSRELVMRGTRKYANYTFDSQGNARFAQGADSDGTVKSYYRKPGESGWTQFGEVYDQNDRENLYRFIGGVYGIVGFHHEDPNIAYFVEALNGEDKAALWTFNLETGQFEEKLFQAENADVMGVGRHSIPGNDKLAFASYPGAKMERHWFDEEEEALYKALEEQIPYSHQLSIRSRSYDGRTMVVYNQGPKDPGSFWLVKEGQLAKLGSRNPLLNQDALADVKFIRYPSRDGKLMIPGYVTVPNGEGPFPLIVLPHGGPAVPEVVTYDEWGQLLASAGYMVLQPGYRQTVGWGKELFDLAFHEHGGTMQDDKDDGALYLVEQGLVDPDRIAMFGWSYGGYAALVAAAREDNIYQCAIAGAAVSRPEVWYNDIINSNTPKAIDEWFQGRGVKYGTNPYAEVDKVNIPLLMVHPEDDSRVLYYHFEDYKKAFEEAGHTGEFITLEDADHFYTTLMYTHQQQFYTKMLDYLANDCGPGGL
ncbi:prolyl oligopeptidase family protein [Erythrobacter sp. NAP1]|uniref:alpha/beta hydrolase family protein n=1 Tax=Erythrobacter sp. NAP1 TaxID=237727 RepID=UPI0000686F27|nr:prolyl oligopeptidase family serine peptidase [Erythrobacter sp. NAP1]EAQ29221.1 prolyl oligopeptidase family protein [Erythrobacter sp. NAP1]